MATSTLSGIVMGCLPIRDIVFPFLSLRQIWPVTLSLRFFLFDYRLAVACATRSAFSFLAFLLQGFNLAGYLMSIIQPGKVLHHQRLGDVLHGLS